MILREPCDRFAVPVSNGPERKETIARSRELSACMMLLAFNPDDAPVAHLHLASPSSFPTRLAWLFARCKEAHRNCSSSANLQREITSARSLAQQWVGSVKRVQVLVR